MDLKDKKCHQAHEKILPLNKENKDGMLKEIGNHWILENSSTRLIKKYKFKNFKKSLEFVNKISDISESENHHPEITFGWGYCEVKVWTHTLNDVAENDFILAAKIEAAFSHLQEKSASTP